MHSLREKVLAGQFVITGELTPPKGTNTDKLIESALILKESVDAINITDNPRSIMRLGSCAVCKLLLENGIEPIFQITCRDRNRIAIQSDLLSASILGIRNILVTTGDSILSGDHREAKPVFDLDSTQVLAIIKKLNTGFDLKDNPLSGNTDFFYGASLNPLLVPEELNLIRIKQKVISGASFLQTQPVFDIDSFRSFYSLLRNENINIPVIGGILLLKSAKAARFINANIPGIHIPENLIDKLEKTDNPLEYAVQTAIEIGKELRKITNGIHIMSIGLEHLVSKVANGIR